MQQVPPTILVKHIETICMSVLACALCGVHLEVIEVLHAEVLRGAVDQYTAAGQCVQTRHLELNEIGELSLAQPGGRRLQRGVSFCIFTSSI